MAVPEQIPVVNYVADGVVKKFDVLFEYDQQSDLHLYVDGVEPTIDKYFFADNAFNFYIAPTIGQDVKIKRITPKERDTDYNLHTNTVRPKALNSDFDRLWYVLQEVFSDVGGLSQEVQDEIIARIQGDEAVSADLKNYIDNMIALIIGDPSFNGINADKVNDASGEAQQQVNYNGGVKWHSRVGGYLENERVVLDNGDIVKSTIDGNVNNPNSDINGWVPDFDTSAIQAEISTINTELSLKADTNYVNAQDSLKADKTYVDTALSSLSTEAAKFYPTLAEANADIANLTVNQAVNIGEAVNGGLWYKATAGATSLTKSAYDPLTQAKSYADENAFFNPVRLTGSESVTELQRGLYHVTSDTIAANLGLPSGKSGELWVSGNTNPPNGNVLLTYINNLGDVYQRRKSTTAWADWNGRTHRVLADNENLNNLTESGIYHCNRSQAATLENNYPFVREGGLVFVENTGTQVRQVVLSIAGEAQRTASLSSGSWSFAAWRGVAFKNSGIADLSQSVLIGQANQILVTNISQIGGHLDGALTEGLYFINAASIATAENGFPITGGAGFLSIKLSESGAVHQELRLYNGYAYRYGSVSGGVASFNAWRGFNKSNNGVADFADYLKQGQNLYTLITNISQIGGHLDSALTEGLYFINSGGIASAANGFPINGSGGFLTIKASSSGAIHQYFQAYNGYAYRYGSVSQGVASFNAWRGVTTPSNGIVDVTATAIAKKNFTVFGSSTTEYLTPDFTDMCSRKNLNYRNHGISGDTTGGSGQAQGSNVVELQFTGGVISASTAVATTFTSTFGTKAVHPRSVELSNGVKGTLAVNGNFTATNLTSDLVVDPSEKLKVTEPTWKRYALDANSIFLFNIGKNDVRVIADANKIFDNTVKMIDYVPFGAQFIVGGHFASQDYTTNDVAIVDAINAKLKSKYGLKYFDINDLLFADKTWTELGLTKTSADIDAIAARRLPPSLARDNGHLSVQMTTYLAGFIENKLIELGYIS